MPDFASNLHALQTRLQKDIVEGTGETLKELSVPHDAEPADRLRVYQNAYLMRLVEIVGKDFDTVWSFVGDEAFYDLAREYVQTHPSRFVNARFFSREFPEFLGAHPKLKNHPEIAEIALIERALEDAFDCEDSPHIEISALEKIAPEAASEARFTFHPSAELLTLKTNAYEIFRALRSEETPPVPIQLDPSQELLVWRKALSCMHKPLALEEAALMRAAMSDESFARLCEICANIDDPETAAMRMAGYLRQWFDRTIISGVTTP